VTDANNHTGPAAPSAPSSSEADDRTATGPSAGGPAAVTSAASAAGISAASDTLRGGGEGRVRYRNRVRGVRIDPRHVRETRPASITKPSGTG